MAGANPARTSWVSEEVRGNLRPLWYKQFKDYIFPGTQVIAAENSLFISTAAGLYALHSDTGVEKWFYATSMPLANSPTYDNGTLYVAGFDKMLHAIDTDTGRGLWTYQAGKGFNTNPLVVGGKVYAGNRDGWFYAVYTGGSSRGQLAWKYYAGGPINVSAAYSNGKVYFASENSYAFALDANSGALVWKSAKLPGAGFTAWWPVVYRNYVIFAGSNNYRTTLGPGPLTQYTEMERNEIYPNHARDRRGVLVGKIGTVSGDWAAGTVTVDTSTHETTANGSTTAVTAYLEQKPWRRTYFVLNKETGQEYTTDFDSDGKPEYAPILWLGTHSGNRYPPVVGKDGVLYQANNYMSDPYITGGQVTGWKIGTPYISVVSSDWSAVDEPMAYSAGGRLVYWNLCCDREAGAFDITIPNSVFAQKYQSGQLPPTDTYTPGREWKYFEYNLSSLLPGYSSYYYPNADGWSTFGGENGIYGPHGYQNPPIPYRGKVFMHRSNTLIAFAPNASRLTQLPLGQRPEAPLPATTAVADSVLRNELAAQVERMLSAGHLRPGFVNHGILSFKMNDCGDSLSDYWHSPADTLYVLLRALPYLPSDLQSRTRVYLQQEFAAFPPYNITHIGWASGVGREAFSLPPEVDADRQYYPPQTQSYGFSGWSFAPDAFYSMWKYAETFGGARDIYLASKDRLGRVPSNTTLARMPHVHNAYIAGYIGYLNLESLAGYPRTTWVYDELNRLQSLRASTFTKDAPPSYFDEQQSYCRGLNIAQNFMYLVPELGQYLHDNALTKVNQAVQEYEYVAPFWFVSRFGAGYGEGAMSSLYDYHAVFQARAYILQETRNQLQNYWDVPAVAVGDLFYIDNLVALLEAAGN